MAYITSIVSMTGSLGYSILRAKDWGWGGVKGTRKRTQVQRRVEECPHPSSVIIYGLGLLMLG